MPSPGRSAGAPPLPPCLWLCSAVIVVTAVYSVLLVHQCTELCMLSSGIPCQLIPKTSAWQSYWQDTSQRAHCCTEKTAITMSSINSRTSYSDAIV